jgi:hypothetical protein
MTISNQSAEDIHHKVDRAAMPGMLNLRNILQLVNDSFNNRPFAGE